MTDKSIYTKVLLTLAFLSSATIASEAKKYPFSIEDQRQVYISRSTAAGTKMVKVIAYGRSADAAIEKAMVDAVAALTFDGTKGLGEFEGCPAVLLNGRRDYEEHKDFFDNFFKKGDFLKFVEKVNSTYPMGADNVKTKNGRRIQIQLIVNWQELSDYYKLVGFKTIASELNNF